MTEPTLTVGYWDLIEEVAYMLGMSSTPVDADMVLVRRFIESGYRQFLVPPLLPNESTVHRWSFLSPTATLALAAADLDYDLPDDFGMGSLVGEFTYAAGLALPEIVTIPESRMRSLRSGTDLTGDPYFAAIRPKTYASGTGTRYEVIFFPTPDTVRTLTYRYNRVMNKLGGYRVTGTGTFDGSLHLTDTSANFTTSGVIATDKVIVRGVTGSAAGTYIVASKDSATQLTLTTEPGAGTGTYEVLPLAIYPLGGAEFSECLLESCMAVAEQRRDDAPGVHSARFAGLVVSCIALDRSNAPDTVGPMTDGSDGPDGWPERVVQNWYYGNQLLGE